MNYESGSITRLKDKAPSLLDMVKSFPSKVVDKFVQVWKESEMRIGEREARDRRERGVGEERGADLRRARDG